LRIRVSGFRVENAEQKYKKTESKNENTDLPYGFGFLAFVATGKKTEDQKTRRKDQKDKKPKDQMTRRPEDQ
jgi:hypothetical protein